MATTMTATPIDRGSNDTTAVHSEGTVLVFERTFNAPRDLVWKAFTDPERIPHWWGKHGTTTTVVEMDVHVGGKWRYVNSSPDRDDVVFYGEYLEINPPESYRWTFMFDFDGVPMGGPESYEFEDLGSKTRVRASGDFETVEALDGALATGLVGGAIEQWDRLEEELAAS